MIPHEEIRNKKDRSWTFKLLDLIENSAPEDDLDDVCRTLGALDDPRAVRPLRSILEDFIRSDHIRRAACNAMNYMCTGCDAFDRRRWWNSGDSILRKVAIVEAKTSEADFLIPVASDPLHEFHWEAIRRLEYGFEEPEYQRLSIAALSHQNPDVREVAAHNLVWLEPIEAVDALLKTLLDPEDSVAEEALFSISYFRSRKVLSGLAEASIAAQVTRRDEIGSVFGGCQEDFEDAYHRLNGESLRYFQRWLKPIEELLDLNRTIRNVESVAASMPKGHQDSNKRFIQTASEIIEFFDDADGCWSEKESWKVNINWESICTSEREKLTDYFGGHTDHTVREIACEPLGLWDRGDVLRVFLSDTCTGVRKRSAYYLKKVTPNLSLAPFIWQTFEDVNSAGWCAGELLDAYVVHAPKDGLEDLLLDIALTEKRTGRKQNAIFALWHLNAHTHIKRLFFLLGEPPLVNWSIHRLLVDYCVEQAIAVPNIFELSEVDDLPLQESLAKAFPFKPSCKARRCKLVLWQINCDTHRTLR